MDDLEAREQVAAVEGLLARVEELPDPAGSLALDAIAAVLELYGEGLARLLGAMPPELRMAAAADELVAHLLSVHGLHPVAVEDRVRAALEEVRPYLGSHGGGVDVLRVADDVAYLRLEGSCNGCPSSAATLRLAVEEAIRKAVPEIERVEAEGVVEARRPLIPLSIVSGSPSASPDDPGWTLVGGLPGLLAGGTLVADVAGEPVLFLRLDDGGCHAHRSTCPGCDEPLAGAELDGSELGCPGCGHRYDVRRAGRCVDEPDLQLEPFPLLTGAHGEVRVAVAARVA